MLFIYCYVYCDTNIFYEQITKFYIYVSQCMCVCAHAC